MITDAHSHPETLLKKMPLAIMNLSLYQYNCFPLMCRLMLRCIPHEETDCVHEGPMDEDTTHDLPDDSLGMEKGIAVVDCMALVHRKKSTAFGIVDLNHSFNELLLSMAGVYDEIILVFDTYKDVSLKCDTREARLQGHCPFQCLIHDETYMKHIAMKRFLSHDKTNADLPDYLTMKVLTYNIDTSGIRNILLSPMAGNTKYVQCQNSCNT